MSTSSLIFDLLEKSSGRRKEYIIHESGDVTRETVDKVLKDNKIAVVGGDIKILYNYDGEKEHGVHVRIIPELEVYILSRRLTNGEYRDNWGTSTGLCITVETTPLRTLINLLDQCTICAIAKNEYDYIYDWVDYHIRLGYDRVCIYDNNTDEHYDELLKPFIDKGQVEIRNVRGIKGVQREVYNEFYSEGLFEYVTILDVDEFMVLKAGYSNIREYIESLPDMQAFAARWVIEKARSYKDTSPIYTYHNPADFDVRKIGDVIPLSCWYKSTYIHGLDIEITEHSIVEGSEGIVCYCEEERVSEATEWTILKHNIDVGSTVEHIEQHTHIRHYMTRNIKDFIKNKYSRGHAAHSTDTSYIDEFNPRMWSQNLLYYTNVNRILTQEDQEYLLQHHIHLNPQFFPSVITYIDIPQDDKEYIDAVMERLQAIGPKGDFIELHQYNPLLDSSATAFGSIVLPTTNTDLPISYKDIEQVIESYKPSCPNSLILHIGYIPDENRVDIIKNLKLFDPQVFIDLCRDLLLHDDQIGRSIMITDDVLYMTGEDGGYAKGNIFLATQPAMKDFCDKIDELDYLLEEGLSGLGSQIADAYGNVSEFLYIW